MIPRLVRSLVLAGLMLTPLLGLSFWLQVIPALGTHGSAGSPVILIKASKDVVLCLICVLWLLGVIRGQPIPCDPLLLVMATLIGVSFLLTAGEGNLLLAVAGLRGLSPFMLVFVAYNYIDMGHVRSIARVLVFLLVVEFLAACVRSKVGASIHGLSYLGLAARPCGTFASPSSWASFLSLIVSFLLGSDIQAFGRPRSRTWVLVTLAVVLILAARSGAGILAIATVIACYALLFRHMHPFLRAALGPIALCSLLLIYQNLQFVTGRSLIFRSMSTRIGIFLDVVLAAGVKEIIIGTGLGVGSNVAVTFAEM
ncbi:MAG: hypothetical protein KBE04_07940, partial [Phycisphaerae bacterium]|nr:hypothetical protein [Phycisphaerae bacterium]